MTRCILAAACFIMCAPCVTAQANISELTVMSYNIRHGHGLDTVLDLSRASALIRAHTPDLCALQEIDNTCLRSDRVNQTEYLADDLGMHGTFGKFMNYQGGEYGMATLSAKPLTSTEILQLPDGIQEPRSVIIHEVQIAESCTIVFANVHFDWIEGKEGEDSRLKQAQALINYLDKTDKAIIIAGDFNCTPNSPTMQYFYNNNFEFVIKGEDNLSYQGVKPAEIDHVIIRNTADVSFNVLSSTLLDEPIVSDHRPFIVELEVKY